MLAVRQEPADLRERRDKRTWTKRLFVIFGLFALPGLVSANPLLTVAGLAVPPLLFMMLWRPGEPPVLLFAATFQWMEVFVPVLTANRFGEILGRSMRLPELQTAAWLALLGLLSLAFGIRLGAGKSPVADSHTLNAVSSRLSPSRLAAAYGLTFVIDMLVAFATGLVPGLRQQLLVFGTLRWVVIFLIGWAALQNSRYRPLATGVFLLEVVLGFSGYFSGFKTVFFLTIVLLGGSGLGIRRLLRPALLFTIGGAIVLSSFWQAVKGDYRSFLSQGEQSQNVLVPITSRFEFLLEKVSDVSLADLLDGLTSGLDRLGYLEFFGRSIQTVPARIPYQSGRLWFEAVKHVVTPRVFFPGKASINDSDRTNEFTGIRVAGADEGTSVSIGYVGESYIDFGPAWMFAPIILVGCFWGWSYRWLAARTPYSPLGIAASTHLILGSALTVEASNIKLLGGAVGTVIGLSLILRYGGATIWRFLAPRA